MVASQSIFSFMYSKHFINLSSLMLPYASYAPTRDREPFDNRNRNIEDVHKALLLGSHLLLDHLRGQIGEARFHEILGQLKAKWREPLRDRDELLEAINRYRRHVTKIQFSPRRPKPVVAEKEEQRDSTVKFDDEPEVIRYDPDCPTQLQAKR